MLQHFGVCGTKFLHVYRVFWAMRVSLRAALSQYLLIAFLGGQALSGVSLTLENQWAEIVGESSLSFEGKSDASHFVICPVDLHQTGAQFCKRSGILRGVD